MNGNLVTPIILNDGSTSVSVEPTAQCDCACSSYTQYQSCDKSNNSLTSNEIFNGGYFSNNDLLVESVGDGFFYAFGKSSKFSVLNKSAFNIYKNFNISDVDYISNNLDAINDLIMSGIIINKASQQRKNKSLKELSIWLHITDICNLRCDYCYLPHEKVNMSLLTAKECIDVAFRSAKENGYVSIKFKIAGGEPLTRFKFIVDIHDYILSRSIFFDIKNETVILTNGTLLTDDIAREVSSKGIKLMISLDGIEEIHDTQRKHKNGTGTFKKVLNAVDLSSSYEIRTDISVTITGKSAYKLHDLTKLLLQRKLFFGFNFYRENILASDKLGLRLDSENIIDGLLKAYKVIENDLPNRSLLASLSDKANLSSPREYTCSAGHDYLVFNTDGDVSQCQMQMHKKVSSISMPNPISDVRLNPSLINHPISKKNDCASCEWKSWCTGGCPVESKLITGSYSSKSPNCKIYKAIFPHILHLEAKRLLKYHNFV